MDCSYDHIAIQRDCPQEKKKKSRTEEYIYQLMYIRKRLSRVFCCFCLLVCICCCCFVVGWLVGFVVVFCVFYVRGGGEGGGGEREKIYNEK